MCISSSRPRAIAADHADQLWRRSFRRRRFRLGTREGLLPVPNRQGDSAHIAFDFVLQRASAKEEETFSARARATA
jgi:hypothetical protein